MSGRQAALAVALVFTAHLAQAQDRAVPRDGGSSGSSAGRDHHSGASSSGDRGSSSGGSQSGGGSSNASGYEPSGAQRRHPRAGTGTGGRRDGRNYYGSSYYYDPYRSSYFYGPSFYGSFGRHWGYSPYYYSGSYGYSPYYYGSRGGYAGAVRVMVEPNETRVYVDGYYAGVADDFDGIFQRLNLAPGRHDISLRLDGYRTQNFKVYVPYDHTIKLHHRMTTGSPTDVSEETVGRPEDVADARRDRGYAPDDRDDDADEADDRDEDELGRGNTRGEVGSLRLLVRPTDASIYVDGAFRGTGRLRTLRLTPGRHRIEIVRPGYRTEEREVDVQPGREVDLSVDLDRS